MPRPASLAKILPVTKPDKSSEAAKWAEGLFTLGSFQRFSAELALAFLCSTQSPRAGGDGQTRTGGSHGEFLGLSNHTDH